MSFTGISIGVNRCNNISEINENIRFVLVGVIIVYAKRLLTVMEDLIYCVIVLWKQQIEICDVITTGRFMLKI